MINRPDVRTMTRRRSVSFERRSMRREENDVRDGVFKEMAAHPELSLNPKWKCNGPLIQFSVFPDPNAQEVSIWKWEVWVDARYEGGEQRISVSAALALTDDQRGRGGGSIYPSKTVVDAPPNISVAAESAPLKESLGSTLTATTGIALSEASDHLQSGKWADLVGTITERDPKIVALKGNCPSRRATTNPRYRYASSSSSKDHSEPSESLVPGKRVSVAHNNAGSKYVKRRVRKRRSTSAERRRQTSSIVMEGSRPLIDHFSQKLAPFQAPNRAKAPEVKPKSLQNAPQLNDTPSHMPAESQSEPCTSEASCTNPVITSFGREPTDGERSSSQGESISHTRFHPLQRNRGLATSTVTACTAR